MGTEPFAVWYGSVGPTNLKEANHTPNNSNLDTNKEGNAEDTSHGDGVDSAASTETSVISHTNKKFTLGHGTNTVIEMSRNSTDEGRGLDHVKDRMESRRKQGNGGETTD